MHDDLAVSVCLSHIKRGACAVRQLQFGNCWEHAFACVALAHAGGACLHSRSSLPGRSRARAARQRVGLQPSSLMTEAVQAKAGNSCCMAQLGSSIEQLHLGLALLSL